MTYLGWKFGITLSLLVVLLLSGNTLTLAQTADEKAVRDIVVKNAEAFEKGDLALMNKIWADDDKVTVIEAGNFDYGWRNFRDKHLGPELKAMQSRKFTASDIRVHIKDKMAWATFAYKIEADFNGRHIDADGAGAMVMEKIKGEWRIVLYSTSGKRRPATPAPEKKN
jgi:ketosteroid isomerase-like protein